MKKKKENIKPYNVILWDPNRDTLEYYDVMPYLSGRYLDLPKDKRPKATEEVCEWLRKEAQYQFWSRCQYEIIVSGWPKGKNEVKLDAYDQLESNLDILTSHFIQEVVI